MRIAGQLPHDLGTAYEVPDPKDMLAIKQDSVFHNAPYSSYDQRSQESDTSSC